mmetsp:Transcript_23039/g.44049  ORF Transcript_23039/g.44049 Transcript_23039/m.44049 type:complete len:118 (-) Transcript_23039:319-672(-)
MPRCAAPNTCRISREALDPTDGLVGRGKLARCGGAHEPEPEPESLPEVFRLRPARRGRPASAPTLLVPVDAVPEVAASHLGRSPIDALPEAGYRSPFRAALPSSYDNLRGARVLLVR